MPKLHISTLMNEIVRTNAIEEIRMWYMFSAVSDLPQPALVRLGLSFLLVRGWTFNLAVIFVLL